MLTIRKKAISIKENARGQIVPCFVTLFSTKSDVGCYNFW